MNRDYDENLLLGYVENDLSDSERATVEQWMRDDARLASLLGAMAEDRQALRDLPEPTPPRWLMDDVDRGLERNMLIDGSTAKVDATGVEQQHTVRRIYFGFAAAASVLIAGGVVIWSVTGPNKDRVAFQPGRSEVAMDVGKTGSGETTDTPGEPNDPLVAGVSKAGGEPTPATEPIGKGGSPSNAVADAEGMHGNVGPPGGVQQRGVAMNNQALEQLKLAPEQTIEPVSIVVQTRDVNRSVEQLNFVANNIDRALVEPFDYNGDPWPYAPNDVQQAPNQAAGEVAAADQAQQAEQVAQGANAFQQQPAPRGILANRTTYTYNLILPADQVDKAVDLMANGTTGAKIDYQDVNLNRFGEARRYESVVNARRNWPRRAPDYGDILRQQLPLETTEVADNVSEQVVVPVIIETQVDAAEIETHQAETQQTDTAN